VDSAGRLELHYCALEGDLDGLKRHLAADVDASAADKQGFTPLHFAAQQGQAGSVRLLLEAGASVDAQDAFGNTPLFRAVFNSRGQGETVEELLRAGANPDFPTTRASPREVLLTRSPTMTSPSSCHPLMRAPERMDLPRLGSQTAALSGSILSRTLPR
jgi:hypothetical protein